jgi:hypothetical protein
LRFFAERDKKHIEGGERILNFFGKKFLTWTSPPKKNGVFELPVLRNAQKRQQKKTKKKRHHGT